MVSTPLERPAVKKFALFTAILFAMGAAPTFSENPPQTANAHQSKTVLIVIGSAGTPEYGDAFARWASIWEKACEIGDANSIVLGMETLKESSVRDQLKKQLSNHANKSSGSLWLVFIGHGTFDGRSAKFNLPGPDLSATELAQWLKPIHKPITIINTASASAPFINALSAPQRIIMTATKSGYEQNYTHFGQYLAEAIADPQADLDKDGQTSLLEAFLTAAKHLDEFYQAQGRIATEHPLLDDNGDGLGTSHKWYNGITPVQKPHMKATLDGYLAHQLHLVPSEAEKKIPPLLRNRRDQLEMEVIKLRNSMDSYSQEEYFSKLEKLLIEIAQIYDRVDNAEQKTM